MFFSINLNHRIHESHERAYRIAYGDYSLDFEGLSTRIQFMDTLCIYSIKYKHLSHHNHTMSLASLFFDNKYTSDKFFFNKIDRYEIKF